MKTLDFCEKAFEDSIDIVVFGATGDLAHKKLFPDLYNLAKDAKFSERVRIIAVGRADFTKDQFIATFDLFIQAEDRDSFFSRVEYFKADFSNLDEMKSLADYLGKHCHSRIFYLAVPPAFYSVIAENLGKVKLNYSCSGHNTFSRIVIEKPFGIDLKSSLELNKTILSVFHEDQVYRIDHYLGKEPVENIFAFRFSNNIFENIWNNKFIDSIQIIATEDIGIEKRGAFYDSTGALIDVFQNHIIQMIAILTMEKPLKFQESFTRTNKANLIKQLTVSSVVKGQYEGYHDEPNVAPDSIIDTFIATKLTLQSPKFKGVPIYVKAGKMLSEKKTQIVVIFKPTINSLFAGDFSSNMLSFQIHPSFNIDLNFAGKVPGFDYTITNMKMNYSYNNYYGELKSEYEKLLIDCILGNQLNFARTDEINASWKVTDVIKNKIRNIPPSIYPQGSTGPAEAETLIKSDGRSWISL